MSGIIEVQNVRYAYEEGGALAVNDVSFTVEEGEFTAILGRNGSGKSTLAKLLNGLYQPDSGAVLVRGMSTTDEAHIWDIRQTAGMVFQNPDNQLVATMVREDVAFGLENTGVATEEMPGRIESALRAVGMEAFMDRAPHLLSGGQKQRVAIAGILAMRPRIIIFDEATAMLDPAGRREVFDTVERLNREGITILWITHFMEEAARCRKIHVMDGGRIVLSGTPSEIFADAEALRDLRLDVPAMKQLADRLQAQGIPVSGDVLQVEDMVREVKRLAAAI